MENRVLRNETESGSEAGRPRRLWPAHGSRPHSVQPVLELKGRTVWTESTRRAVFSLSLRL